MFLAAKKLSQQVCKSKNFVSTIFVISYHYYNIEQQHKV